MAEQGAEMTEQHFFEPQPDRNTAYQRVLDIIGRAVERQSAELYPEELAAVQTILKDEFMLDSVTFPKAIHQCYMKIKREKGVTRTID